VFLQFAAGFEDVVEFLLASVRAISNFIYQDVITLATTMSVSPGIKKLAC
jgi:hypothetical protein